MPECLFFILKLNRKREEHVIVFLTRSGDGCRSHPPPTGRLGAVTSLHRIKHPSHTTISSGGLSAMHLIDIFIEPIGFWLLPCAKRTQMGLNMARSP